MKEQTGEVDLIELILKFFRFFKNRIWIYLILVAVGAVIGAVVFFVSPVEYEQELIGYSPIVDADILVEVMNDVSRPSPIKFSAYEEDMDVLKVYKGIVSIDIEFFSKEKGKELLKIKFVTKSQIAVDSLVDFIEYNILKNDYAAKNLSVKRAQLAETISFIEAEIIRRKEGVGQKNNTASAIVDGEETPSTLFIDKLEYEENLNFFRPFILVKTSSFIEFSKPSLLVFLIEGALLGFVLLSMFYVFYFLNKLASRSEN